MRVVQFAGAYSPSAGRLTLQRLEPESYNSREGKLAVVDDDVMMIPRLRLYTLMAAAP